MKISVFPKGEADAIVVHKTLSVFDWLDSIATLPIDGVELYSRMFFGQDASFVERIGDALGRLNLVMPMLCASPDFTHPSYDQRQREIDQQVEMMRAGHAISGPGVAVRVLSGQRHPGVSDEQGVEWAAEAITSLLPLAKELDIVLALENHYKDGMWEFPEFVQRKELFMELLGRIDERVHFGVQYDPSNAIVAGEDSVEFLKDVIGDMVTMQASDRSLAEGASLAELAQSDGTIGYSPLLQHSVIGTGLNDYDAIFSILWDNGYNGWISIEDGINGLEDMRRSVDFLVQARETYFHGSTDVAVAAHDARRQAARKATDADLKGAAL
jgi:sugar phosphate isomerase/epimerase